MDPKFQGCKSKSVWGCQAKCFRALLNPCLRNFLGFMFRNFFVGELNSIETTEVVLISRIPDEIAGDIAVHHNRVIIT